MTYREPKEILISCRCCGKKPLKLDEINIKCSDSSSKICLGCAPIHTTQWDPIAGVHLEI